MGMHQPGWRERNEEQAWEGWRSEVTGHLIAIRHACERIANAQWDKNAPGRAIVDALEEIDTASEELFRLRDGPENPADH